MSRTSRERRRSFLGSGIAESRRRAQSRRRRNRLTLLVEVDVLEVGAATAAVVAEVDAVLEVVAAIAARAGVGRFEAVVYPDADLAVGGVEGRLEVKPLVLQAAGDAAAVDDGRAVVGQVAAAEAQTNR